MARFLAMAMTEQAHHCSSGLTKTLDFILHFMHLFSPWQNTSKLALPIWLNENVRFLAMAMTEQAHHCSFGLTKTFVLSRHQCPG